MSEALPSGWINTNLESIAFINMGQSPKSIYYNSEGKGLPFFQGKAEFGHVNPTPKKWCTNPSKIAERHDILLSVRAPVGPTNLCSEQSCIGRGLAAIRGYHGIDQNFLYYHFKNIEGWLQDQGTGSTFQAINGGFIKQLSVNVPPANEQKRIAEKLEQLLTAVDATKNRLDKVPTLLKRFRQSVLAAAVSGELTRDWRVKNNIDFQWDDTDINSVVKEIRYGTSKKCMYDDSLTPVLRIPNVKGRFIDLTDMKYAEFTEKEIEKLSLRKGDILIVRSNGSVDLVGKAVEVTKREAGYLFAGYLIRLRFDSKILSPGFLQIILSSPMVRHIIEVNARSTSGVHNINSKELASIKFLKPTISEQEEITQRVAKLMEYADKLEARLHRSVRIMGKLTASILQKAFTGKLLPQDRSDEPAEKLLNQIQASRIKK